ncbi:MAG TPA: GMC family oxidoreductase [Micromonosporaceae bacterium]|nr:GMC family oxidoreductase [Micromonosporaceae bacterium]
MGEKNVEHVHAVVVGSGFGGSVAAYRLAEAGRSVVLLERGKAYRPGDFARTPAEMGRNLWDPSEGLHGLFDIWSFRGVDGVVSSGLGGGSLIYANVLLRKDERWFVRESPLPRGGYEHWPISRADLDPHYDRVERMMGATPYPYPATRKTEAMRLAAQRLNAQRQGTQRPELTWDMPPLAVAFAGGPGEAPVPGAPIRTPAYGNLHGRPRRTCRLCGECDIGCNDGAKNSLDHTYLSAAKHHGADLRTRCEVREIEPLDGGGYEVRYVAHDPATEGQRTATRDLPLRRIACDRLVLAAGTFGTTYLLLRNREQFLPRVSDALGTRFSGNGDLLGFLLGAKDPAAAGGHRRIEGSRGPVITSAIRVGDANDHNGAGGNGTGDRGFYIEDAGYPVFAEWLVEAAQMRGILHRALRFAALHLRGRFGRTRSSNVSALVAGLLGPGRLGDGSLPLLGMGRDVPDGVMRLRRDRLEVDWTTATSAAYLARVRGTMRDIANELGARYQDNPLWWARKVVTVHPLGGAPMGRRPQEGTCDAFGEVFSYPGLYVLDGAVLPGPVGPNPSLTIAAVADRACDRMLDKSVTQAGGPAAGGGRAASTNGRGARANGHGAAAGGRAATAGGHDDRAAGERAASAGGPVPAGPPDAGVTGLSFTEEMKGFVDRGDADPARAAEAGRRLDQRLMFHLTITVDDVDRFVDDPAQEGRAEGYVECGLLGGRLPVQRGWFNLFTRGAGPSRRRMLYRLHLTGGDGSPLTLVGHKDVHDDPGFDVWRDTSTLYLRVLEGHVQPDGDESAGVVASGVITIHIPDFLRQLTTFRAHGPRPAHAMERFGRLFLGELWDAYGPKLP